MATRIPLQHRHDYTVKFDERDIVESDGARRLEISRPNFGTIRYLEPVKLRNLEELDEIVFINHQEVILYPDEKRTDAPPVGEGLNCPAEVILERIWPPPGKNYIPNGFENRLRKICERQDAEFISYNEKSGMLKFKVKHFSKYSCNIEEEDDEEDEVVDGNTATGNSKRQLTTKVGLGGVALDDFKKRQENTRTHVLQALQQPLQDERRDNQDQILDRYLPSAPPDNENPTPTVFYISTPRVVHFGGGDGYYPECNKSKCNDALGRPLTPLPPDSTKNRIYPFPGTTLFTPPPPSQSTTSLKESMSRPSPVLKSSESLRSQIMKNVFLDEEVSGKQGTDFLQQPVPIPPTRTKSRATISLFKEASFTTGERSTPSPFLYKPKTMDIQKPELVSKSKSVPTSVAPRELAVVQKEVQFLSVGKPEFEDLFRSIRPKERTTLCKLFGAPRVCFTGSGHFITIKNNMTATGFKGSAKISSFESYSEKQDNFPFSESYRNVLKNELMKQLKQGGEVLFKEYAEIVRGQLMKTNLPTTRSYLKSELIIWELCEILWPGKVTDQNILKDEGFLLLQRKELSGWLVKNAPFIFGKAYNAADNSMFGLLKKGRVDEACVKAMDEGNDWLAILLASTDFPLDCVYFKEIFQFFPEQSLDILNLRNGTLELEELATENVSNMWAYNYLQYFSLYVWYYGLRESTAVDQLIRNFEQMMRDIVGDDEAPLPKVESSSVSTLCVHLLKLYSCSDYPVHKLLTPLAWTNDILDYKLSWLLMRNLEEIGYFPESDVYSNVCISFSGQLEAIDMFEWAVFVSKFSLPQESDEDLVVGKAKQASDLRELMLLEKHLESGDGNLEKEIFLKTELNVEEGLIYKIKGEKASSEHRYDLMIGYFCRVGEYQKAFNVLKEYLDFYGVDVVSESGSKLDGYSLNVFKHLLMLQPYQKRIAGWEVHGKLMVNYFKLSGFGKSLSADLPPSSSESIVNDKDAEFAVLEFMKAIIKYNPENVRQRSFLLDLTLKAQKAIQQIVVDKKVACTTKDKIKEGLISFMDIAIPMDYFDGFRDFVTNMILNDISTQTMDEQNLL